LHCELSAQERLGITGFDMKDVSFMVIVIAILAIGGTTLRQCHSNSDSYLAEKNAYFTEMQSAPMLRDAPLNLSDCEFFNKTVFTSLSCRLRSSHAARLDAQSTGNWRFLARERALDSWRVESQMNKFEGEKRLLVIYVNSSGSLASVTLTFCDGCRAQMPK
jgi:hypothetical protein